jgi:hypothetical protein
MLLQECLPKDKETSIAVIGTASLAMGAPPSVRFRALMLTCLLLVADSETRNMLSLLDSLVAARKKRAKRAATPQAPSPPLSGTASLSGRSSSPASTVLHQQASLALSGHHSLPSWGETHSARAPQAWVRPASAVPTLRTLGSTSRSSGPLPLPRSAAATPAAAPATAPLPRASAVRPASPVSFSQWLVSTVAADPAAGAILLQPDADISAALSPGSVPPPPPSQAFGERMHAAGLPWNRSSFVSHEALASLLPREDEVLARRRRSLERMAASGPIEHRPSLVSEISSLSSVSSADAGWAPTPQAQPTRPLRSAPQPGPPPALASPASPHGRVRGGSPHRVPWIRAQRAGPGSGPQSPASPLHAPVRNPLSRGTSDEALAPAAPLDFQSSVAAWLGHWNK